MEPPTWAPTHGGLSGHEVGRQIGRSQGRELLAVTRTPAALNTLYPTGELLGQRPAAATRA